MLGTRGCRLGLQCPEIYEMQVRAIVRAARAVAERTGEAPLVEIMHPLVGFAEELRRLRELTERVAAEEAEVEYRCGTMIELPRACIRADEIAEHADFFSFGTNDLTQTALGFSRDDAEGKFLTYYLEHGVLERNPFEVLDREGVGELMRIAVERGRGVEARPQARDLRRARRRAALGRVLPRARARLRLVLALPRAARPPRRGAGGACRRGRDVGRRRRLSSATRSSRRGRTRRAGLRPRSGRRVPGRATAAARSGSARGRTSRGCRRRARRGARRSRCSGSAKVRARLSTIRPSPARRTTRSRRYSRTSSAPMIPKIAPDAPTVDCDCGLLSEQRAGRAGEARDEVDEQEPRRAERLLDDGAEPVERQHVEREVEEARVEEHRRHEPVPVARPRRPRRRARQLVEQLAARRADAGALVDRDEVDEDVERDEADRRRHLEPRDGSARVLRGALRRGCRPSLGGPWPPRRPRGRGTGSRPVRRSCTPRRSAAPHSEHETSVSRPGCR